MDWLQEQFEGKIDFVGQQIVERISRISIIVFTVLSFVLGFVFQNLPLTFAVLGVSVAVLFLVVVPPWPAYNSHPPNWLPVKVKKKEG